MSLIFVDVEAGGIDGGSGVSPYSGVMTEFGAVSYKTGNTFHGVIWLAKPSEDNPAVSNPIKMLNQEGLVMDDFVAWIKENSDDKPVFISDNPAYDWQWISYYFDKVGIENPFGHSARRIGDFYAGVVGNWRAASKWKKLRDTKHDHNPVNDAMGNVEAFRKIMRMVSEQNCGDKG